MQTVTSKLLSQSMLNLNTLSTAHELVKSEEALKDITVGFVKRLNAKSAYSLAVALRSVKGGRELLAAKPEITNALREYDTSKIGSILEYSLDKIPPKKNNSDMSDEVRKSLEKIAKKQDLSNIPKHSKKISLYTGR
jgi:hypothetical protein